MVGGDPRWRVSRLGPAGPVSSPGPKQRAGSLPAMAPAVRALRGATTVDEDTVEQVTEAAQKVAAE